MVGKTLSHYEIREPLGAGGMAELYRARDTKLDRDVAIKVLPEELAADPDRLARFDREARLLASLNHANIGSIYGLEETDGVHFLVLELIEGESLERRLQRGPIPVPEALDIARQIAEALEAAHEAGIIHRDVKPANVLLTGKGGVKVLDFGIAKSTTVEANAALTEQATSLTVDGTLIGTPPYMAPEQIRGGDADKRADIWAFGCVVYEMLTGKGAFARETVADTLVAVLEAEPDWGALPAAVPRHAEAVLRRCLRKDTNRRMRDVGDARIEIMEDAPASERESDLARASSLYRNRWASAAPWALAFAMTALALFALYGNERPAARMPIWVPALQPDIEPRLTISQSPPFALSPDGATLLYWQNGPSGESQLYSRRLDESHGAPVAEPGSVGRQTSLTFSTNGEQIVFENDDTLFRMPLDGATSPIPICPLPGGPGSGLRGSSWGPNGDVFVGLTDRGIARVSLRSRSIEALTDEFLDRWPQVLPGGDTVIFTRLRDGDWDDAAVAILDVETRQVEILEGIRGTYPRYVPTGHLLFARDGSLFAVPFDVRQRRVTGAEMPVISDLSVDSDGNGSAHYSVADTGLLVYSSREVIESDLVSVNRRGDVEPLGFDVDEYGALDVDQNGRLAIQRGFPIPLDLQILDLQTRNEVTLRASALVGTLVWWPDGRRLAFSSAKGSAGGLAGVVTVDVDAVSTPVPTTDGTNHQFATSFSPNGDVLVYQQQNTATSWDLYSVALDGESSPQVLVSSPRADGGGALSPDGSLLAYASFATGTFQVYVKPFGETSNAHELGLMISIAGGGQPVWSPDGKELFFIERGDPNRLMVATITTEPTLAREGKPVEVLNLDEHQLLDGNSNFRASYDLMPAGDRYVFRRLVRHTPSRLHLVVDWFEELKERVPTGR